MTTATKIKDEDIHRAWKGNNQIYQLINDRTDDVDVMAVLEIYCSDIAHYLGVPVDDLHAALNEYDDKQEEDAQLMDD